jgi:acetylornithine deacetylase/succinyl-diaminopimelate desuccinylase-like protein
VDVRTLPGEGHDDVDAHLRAALGDLYERVEVEVVMDDPASISRTDTPAVGCTVAQRSRSPSPPPARPRSWWSGSPTRVCTGRWAAVAYGAGLFSPDIEPAEFGRRFHGNDERVDVESLATHDQPVARRRARRARVMRPPAGSAD